MGSEFDFEPIEERLVAVYETAREVCGCTFTDDGRRIPFDHVASMARELRVARAAMRAMVESSNGADYRDACATIRALVAHIGPGEEGRDGDA